MRAILPFGDVTSLLVTTNAIFSPGGRWVAYQSYKGSGDLAVVRPEDGIFVQPFPATSAKYQISSGTGIHPVWSPDGKELMYAPRSTAAISAVTVTTQPVFAAGNPQQAVADPDAGMPGARSILLLLVSPMASFRFVTVLAIVLCAVWVVSGQQSSQGSALTIVVISGEDAINIVQQKTAVAPVVEVRDRNNQPVAGAIVRFAIQGGRATFGGAQTLTVTTNAVGQAVATGLTPTASGALQIGASAAFQGQTAAITIAQTNVMTVAQAAAVSGAAGTSSASGAGASGTAAPAGAAGSGGTGGVSGTTVGVVGGAAAGGALVAVKALSGGAEETRAVTTYRGSYSMRSVFNSTTTTNGVVTGFCADQPVSITGNITVTLDQSGAGNVDADWTENIGAAGFCPGIAPGFHASGPVDSAANISLASETGTTDFSSTSGTVHLRRSWAFTGALSVDVVTGRVTMLQEQTLIAPSGPGIVLTGGYPEASTPVTLSRVQ